jgi:hypothetical protein
MLVRVLLGQLSNALPVDNREALDVQLPAGDCLSRNATLVTRDRTDGIVSFAGSR